MVKFHVNQEKNVPCTVISGFWLLKFKEMSSVNRKIICRVKNNFNHNNFNHNINFLTILNIYEDLQLMIIFFFTFKKY